MKRLDQMTAFPETLAKATYTSREMGSGGEWQHTPAPEGQTRTKKLVPHHIDAAKEHMAAAAAHADTGNHLMMTHHLHAAYEHAAAANLHAKGAPGAASMSESAQKNSANVAAHEKAGTT